MPRTYDQILIDAGLKRAPITGAPVCLDDWKQIFDEALPVLRQAVRASAAAARQHRFDAAQQEINAAARILDPRNLGNGWSFREERDRTASNLIVLDPPAYLTGDATIRVTVEQNALTLWSLRGGKSWTVGPGMAPRKQQEVVAWVLLPSVSSEAAASMAATLAGVDQDT